jgi:hypothetical protein
MQKALEVQWLDGRESPFLKFDILFPARRQDVPTQNEKAGNFSRRRDPKGRLHG